MVTPAFDQQKIAIGLLLKTVHDILHQRLVLLLTYDHGLLVSVLPEWFGDILHVHGRAGGPEEGGDGSGKGEVFPLGCFHVKLPVAPAEAHVGKGAVGAGEVLHVQLIAPIYDIGFDGKHQVRVHTIVGYEDLYTFGGLGVTAVDRYTAKRKPGQYVEYGHQGQSCQKCQEAFAGLSPKQIHSYRYAHKEFDVRYRK